MEQQRRGEVNHVRAWEWDKVCRDCQSWSARSPQSEECIQPTWESCRAAVVAALNACETSQTVLTQPWLVRAAAVARLTAESLPSASSPHCWSPWEAAKRWHRNQVSPNTKEVQLAELYSCVLGRFGRSSPKSPRCAHLCQNACNSSQNQAKTPQWRGGGGEASCDGVFTKCWSDCSN